MVRDTKLRDLIPVEGILELRVYTLEQSEATRVMTSFDGQIVRTLEKDYLLIDGKFIGAIHIKGDEN